MPQRVARRHSWWTSFRLRRGRDLRHGRLFPDDGQQAMENSKRGWRAAWDNYIDRDHLPDAARSRKTRAKDPARNGASSYRYDPFWGRHRLIGLAQGQPHRIRDRAGDQQDVGITRRRRDEKAEAVHVVIRIVELARLADAGAARPRIDKADVQRPPEDPVRLVLRRRSLARIGGPFVAGFPSGGFFILAAVAASESNERSSRVRWRRRCLERRSRLSGKRRARSSARSAELSRVPLGRPGKRRANRRLAADMGWFLFRYAVL